MYQPEVTFELFSISREQSFDYCFDFTGVGMKAFAAENVFEVLDRRLNKDAFLAFQLYFRWTLGLENVAEYPQMIIQVGTLSAILSR